MAGLSPAKTEEEDGEKRHGVAGADQEAQPHILGADDEEGDVEHKGEHPQGDGGQLTDDHADAHDAAVQNGGRNQKFFQCKGR